MNKLYCYYNNNNNYYYYYYYYYYYDFAVLRKNANC